jgi:phosphoribosyl-AMP cyclohydrolase / phosphoribosyl-ATP pyrophosphohydrolase
VRIRDARDLDALTFDPHTGLLPVVTQHAWTGEVLMLAYADRGALERCLASGTMWYYSRSRDRLWLKGESSGNHQRIHALHADCDRDTVLALVEPAGPACHTGSANCFEAAAALPRLDGIIAGRRTASPGTSYTARLLADGNLRLKKLGEESVELALACAAGDTKKAAAEAADLVFHLLVACSAEGVRLEHVLAALGSRLPADEDAVDDQQQDRADDRQE